MSMTPELNQAPARHRKLVARGTALAACGILAAACGSAASPGSTTHGGTSGPASSTSGSTTSAAKVSLTIAVTGGVTTKAEHWTLRCEPAGGTFPNPTLACARLLKDKTLFFPAPVHIMCPMIMADAKSYLVNGTFLGRAVHESIVDGGCELGRWSELNHVFN
jgi:Subtilisin inhibitor-like